MVLKQTHLKKMNFIERDVNEKLIDPETYEPLINKIKPRQRSDPYGIPPLVYWYPNKNWQRNISVFKDFQKDSQVSIPLLPLRSTLGGV